MESQDRIEVRLLGRLHVRRADGSIVDAKQWRTGKTVDLLRLLALEAGRPVRTESLLDKLWPEVDEAHGRASLRTAASQIRRTLDADCIERKLGGLVLTNVWVDIVAYRTLVMEAKAMLRANEHARVVSLAREAESLYLKDFQAHDDGSCWAMEVRSELAAMRQGVLADAAESAATLHWMRDCIDFAGRAIAADPCSERAHRSLMLAYAALGETEQALRVFDHCRRTLAEELGADPSPRTHAAYMQVLSGQTFAPESQVYVGRQRELELLVATLDRAISDERREVVCVNGAAGSGRDALIVEAAAQVGAESLLTSRPEQGKGSWQQVLDEVASSNKPAVVTLPAIDDLGADELGRLAAALGGDSPLVFAVPATPAAAASLTRSLADLGVRTSSVESDALLYPDLAELARTLLSGPVTPSLVDTLWSETGGLAGRAVAMLHTWSSGGRVVATSSGLELIEKSVGSEHGHEVGDIVRLVLEQLSPAEMQTIQLAALMNVPVTPQLLLPLLTSTSDTPDDAGAVRQLLERLVELSVMSFGPRGYEFRHPHMRDAAESWARPTVRSRLHRRIAESGILDASTAAWHWMKAGEPRIACDKVLEAAAAPMTGAQAETQLAKANEFAEALAPNPTDHATALERLGDKAHEFRLFRQARQFYLSALASSQLGRLGTAPRLRGKIHSASMDNSAAPSVDHGDEPTVLEVAVGNGWGQRLEQMVLEAMADVSPGRTMEIRFSAPESSGPLVAVLTSQGTDNVVPLVQPTRAPRTEFAGLVDALS